jgi:deoxycytidine triphosphate deaminase
MTTVDKHDSTARGNSSPDGSPVSKWQDVASRQELREAARVANAGLGFAKNEDDAEADRRYRQYRSLDPFPDIPPALLNSADIADYVARTSMIHPFHPELLKSASYEVALFGKYFYISADGTRFDGDLKAGETAVLPKNSIGFMSVEPYFRLPDYIALRHNLKIDHIYKGLLVGTGPLIDPGFTGRIGLPLHNLTENDYTFVGGKGIIWVEFTKLSPNPAWANPGPPEPRRGAYVSFPAERTATKQVEDYVRDAVGLDPVPASSSAAIAARAKKAVKVATSTRNILRGVSFAAAITVAALSIAIAVQLVSMSQQLTDVRIEIAKLQSNPLPGATPSPMPTLVATPTPAGP